MQWRSSVGVCHGNNLALSSHPCITCMSINTWMFCRPSGSVSGESMGESLGVSECLRGVCGRVSGSVSGESVGESLRVSQWSLWEALQIQLPDRSGLL